MVNETLPVSVSLTRSGLPRIIPRRHRHCISCGDERADYLVRLYLSWFGLSRIIELAKPISRSTFESITTPVKDIESEREIDSPFRASPEDDSENRISNTKL